MHKPLLEALSKFRIFIYSDEGLIKKAYLNALASFLDYFARFIVAFLINPYLLKGLGDYFYGVLQLLAKFSGFLNLASGRPTEALKWAIAHKQYSLDFSEKKRILSNALVIWSIFLPFMLIIGIIFIYYAPLLLKAPFDAYLTIRIAAGLLLFDIVLMGLSDIPKAVLRGENMEYKRMGVSTLLIVLWGSFTYIAIYIRAGIVGVLLVNVINTCITGVYFLKVVKDYINWFGLEKPLISEIKRYLALNWWFLLWQFVTQLLISGDVILLGLLISPQNIPQYTITKYAPEVAISIITALISGTLPGIGVVIGTGDLVKAIQLRKEFISISWLSSLSIGTTCLVLYPSFINLWVGNKYYAGPETLLLIILMITQLLIIRSDAYLIDLTLDIKHKVFLGLVSIAISILLALIMFNMFSMGFVGFCLGHILGRLLLSFAYPWLIGKYFRLSFELQIKESVRPALVLLLSFVAAHLIGKNYVVNNWGMLIILSALIFLISSIIAFRVGLSGGMQDRLMMRMKSLILIQKSSIP